MNIGLVGPTDCGATGNPGWHMITAGIRWLVRHAIFNVVFTPVNMSRFDDSWTAAESACDAIIVCGNPRFSMSEGDAFWEHEMWSRLHAAHLHGVRIIDGWAGSAFPYTDHKLSTSDMATALMFAPKRRDYLNIAKQFHGRITRDPTMQCIYERAHAPSVMLPCSSWWARDEYGVNEGNKSYDVVVLYRMDDWPHVIDELRMWQDVKLSERSLRMVATTVQDYLWAREHELNVELVADAVSLLHVFASADRVVSFRLHSTIPAASLGCTVAAISVDSRTDACRLFELPVTGFTDICALQFGRATVPDTDNVVDVLRDMLT